MPVRLHSSRFSQNRGQSPENNVEEPCSREPITIGLVNNMPKAAFKSTEKQFISLLDSACNGLPIELSLHVLRGAPMASFRSNSASLYSCTDELVGCRLDGLIVTGTEPTTAALQDEPYWESFSQLLAWARNHTSSTIWSCLAAHAAVLHMDGIERQRSHTKRFGIFQCHRVSDDRLLTGTAPGLSMPHSRWNGVEERELLARGYKILTRTDDREVDTFVKQEDSLFIFFQGHPEYSTDTLLREYRRDIGRFLQLDAMPYPPLPHGYFAHATEDAFSSLERSASSLNRGQILDAIATVMPNLQIENTWRPSAVRIYSNWLEHLRASKDLSQRAENLEISRAACH